MRVSIADLNIVSQEKKEVDKDEATEHAKSYWMMGWTWGEISSVLEDMGFSDNEADKAVKNAQEYAKMVLKDGPFNVFKDGQIASLINGSFGRILSVGRDWVVVDIDGEKVRVSAKNINFENTKKLSEACELRNSANEEFDKVAKYDVVFDKVADEFSTPAIKEIEKVSPKLPSPVKQDKALVPEETFEFKHPEIAPKHFDTPRLVDIDTVTNLAEESLNQLDVLKSNLDSLQSELETANEMAKEIRERKKELTEKQFATAQKAFAIISTQKDGIHELDKVVFHKYGTKLVAVYKKLVSAELPVGPVDELNAVYEFLSVNHPEIVEETYSAIETWKKQNTLIQEQIVSGLVYYKAPQKKVGQLFDKIVDWVTTAWKNTKKVLNKVMNSIIPMANEGANVMGNFLVAEKAHKAVIAAKMLVNLKKVK